MSDLMSQLGDVLNVYEFSGNLLSNKNKKFKFKPMDVKQIKRVLSS